MPRKTKKSSETVAPTFQIQWTDEAINTLWEAWIYLAQYSEETADRMKEEIERRILDLQQYPYIGPLLPDLSENPKEYRQVVIKQWPYRVIYQVETETKAIRLMCIHPIRGDIRNWLSEP